MSLKSRVAKLEEHDGSGGTFDIAEAMREARERRARGEPSTVTPITQVQLDDPVHGKWFCLIQEARERAQNWKDQ